MTKQPYQAKSYVGTYFFSFLLKLIFKMTPPFLEVYQNRIIQEQN